MLPPVGRYRRITVAIRSNSDTPSPTTPGTSALPMSTRLARLGLSWVGVAIGVPLLVRADLGVSPFDVLNTGISEATGLSFGLSFVVDSLVFFLAGWLLGARLGWASVTGTIVIGPLIDLVLGIVPEPDGLVARGSFMIIGIAVIATAICLVVTTDLGAGPTEILMLGLVHRGMALVPARWVSDGLPVVVGVVLGGSVGVGTVVFVLAMGPLITFGLRRLHYTPARREVAAAAAAGF
jgi:uncharacterized membrane protein YczE